MTQKGREKDKDETDIIYYNIMECKSNLKNFLESVYSNLKKSYKLLLDTSFLLKTFQGISRETCCGKIFLDFNFLNSMCNEIEGNIDLRKYSSILGILEKPLIPRSN